MAAPHTQFRSKAACLSGPARVPPAASPRWNQADLSALLEAHAVMAAGCRFLISRNLRAAAGAHLTQPYPKIRLRMAGNGLKELDRFLSILIDECGRIGGLTPDARADFTSGAEMPRKLCRLDSLGGRFSRDMPRLRAIGRVRLAASGEQPIAFGARLDCDLAVASAGSASRQGVRGSNLEISDQALAAIAEFYLSIADRLRALFAGPETQP